MKKEERVFKVRKTANDIIILINLLDVNVLRSSHSQFSYLMLVSKIATKLLCLTHVVYEVGHFGFLLAIITKQKSFVCVIYIIIDWGIYRLCSLKKQSNLCVGSFLFRLIYCIQKVYFRIPVALVLEPRSIKPYNCFQTADVLLLEGKLEKQLGRVLYQ